MSYRDWHVGMKVVCVSEPFDGGWGHVLPVVGSVYTLRQIGPGISDRVMVKLVEIVNPVAKYPSRKYGPLHGEVCFGADLFRPVETRATDISIFTAMLSPERGKVEA